QARSSSSGTPAAAAASELSLMELLCAGSQKAAEVSGTRSTPSPLYPSVNFQVVNVNHLFLREDKPEQSQNSSFQPQTQTFLINGPGALVLPPSVNASYGPLTIDASIASDLLLTGRKILPVILVRQIRSSSPIVKILFHMPRNWNITVGEFKAKDGAHCVTAYAFWETREVRGACLVSPGGFCVAHLKLEPIWFSSASRSGSSSREAERTKGIKGLQGNVVEVYFQSRRDQSGQCAPQDSLERVGVGRQKDPGGTGIPMRRIGSVTLVRAPPGNPIFLRLRLGGALVVQTSSKPLKTSAVATFYIFLINTCLVVLPTLLTCHVLFNFSNRGLLEVLQLDFVPKDVSDQLESQTISWRLELPGNVKDVGLMRIFTTQRDYAGLAPIVMDLLNTAVLTGKAVSVPVMTLAVEANGSVSDVTNYTTCRSTQVNVIKVSERCDYLYVNGKEKGGKSSVMVNFTYGFLSAQLEMSVWLPRLPLHIDVANTELSQIKGWRVPVTTSNRRSTWDSEEEEEMRKGRGCMLQYQHTPVRVLTRFVATADSAGVPEALYNLFFFSQIDVTNLVRSFLKTVDPDIARLQDGSILQGRAVGMTTLQVLSPLTSSVLAERSIRVLDDKVSVTELGVQLVSGLSLSLRVSPGSNRAIVATATTRETITQLKQEALVSCWVQFSDGAIVPLDLFDSSVYSLTVSTPDESVATVRRTPKFTFVVAQGESGGQGALVRVELRICEECQKSKRKSKLAVGTGLLKINLLNSSAGTGQRDTVEENQFVSRASEAMGELKKTVQSQGKVNTKEESNPAKLTTSTLPNKNMMVIKAELTPKKEPPKSKTPKVIESNLIRTFKALSDMEIGMYALVGVSCLAILAFLLNCLSYNLCFRNHKTPIQANPAPHADPKGHKHDWVWLGSDNPHRTATLGRSRSSSQQHFKVKAIDPMANRSATLLARPHRSEPLHSPTSKRNQVQFTTFTTLDIKHLAALKKNGVDFNWPNRQPILLIKNKSIHLLELLLYLTETL
uniref:Si:dkey-1d7.3 n=1 Tax=Gouania willdenowi TaxID=441366 RepID=A0A8C5GGH5_GOUWI